MFKITHFSHNRDKNDVSEIAKYPYSYASDARLIYMNGDVANGIFGPSMIQGQAKQYVPYIINDLINISYFVKADKNIF